MPGSLASLGSDESGSEATSSAWRSGSPRLGQEVGPGDVTGQLDMMASSPITCSGLVRMGPEGDTQDPGVDWGWTFALPRALWL